MFPELRQDHANRGVDQSPARRRTALLTWLHLIHPLDPSGVLISIFFGLVFAAGHLNQEVRDYEAIVSTVFTLVP